MPALRELALPQTREVRTMRRDCCVHFNGVQNTACEAGCVYDEMDAGRKVPYRAALPCFEPSEKDRVVLAARGVEQATCPHRRPPTDEEIAAFEQEVAKAMTKAVLALTVIDPLRKEHAGKDWRGVVTCPACNGRLHVGLAGNGHARAKCETDNCVAFIE